jgi:hypothetical protein
MGIINSSLTKERNHYTMLKKGLKKFEKITRAVKTGWAPPLKTRTYVTDLLSGMVTVGYPPSPPCQRFNTSKVILFE